MKIYFAVAVISLMAVSVLAEVPPPSKTPAKVIVSGRTSTEDEIKVVNVGNDIPVTYSPPSFLHNTTGFSWWVSQHFALKTDYTNGMAEFYLKLLELAYPHYVELFKCEPQGIEDKRMALVYASSVPRMKEAMASDYVHWNVNGGGIAYPGINIAYMYQCYDIDVTWDQPRYIVIHEMLHQFHYLAAGYTATREQGWTLEGFADRFSNHVYDAKKKQLTINVFDKGGPLHMPELGLNAVRKDPSLTMERVVKHGGSREMNVLVCTFLDSTPERAQKFALWYNETLVPGCNSIDLLTQIFGPWEKLNAEFKLWCDERRPSYSTKGRQWSQDGDTLWAFTSPPGSTNWSYIGVNMPPGKKGNPDEWRHDYPMGEVPSLVGPVKRGVAEPSVGCVVDLSRRPESGCAGMALGIKTDANADPVGGIKILIASNNLLMIEGESIGISNSVTVFPADVENGMNTGGHRAGITAQIATNELRVTVRTRGAKEKKDASFLVKIPLTPDQHKRLLHEPLAFYAQSGNHGVTPFCDPEYIPLPDMLEPAPANRWRNPGDAELQRMFRAIWHLKDKAPASFVEMRDIMLNACDKDLSAQKAALKAFNKAKYKRLLPDLVRCGADSRSMQSAFMDLSGVSIDLNLMMGNGTNEVVAEAVISGASEGRIKGDLVFKADCDSKTNIFVPISFKVKEGRTETFRQVICSKELPEMLTVNAALDLKWQGEQIRLETAKTSDRSIPCWWIIGPFDNPGGAGNDVRHPVEKEKLDLAGKYTGVGGKQVEWKRVRRTETKWLTDEFIVDLGKIYGNSNAAAYAVTWVVSPCDMDVVLGVGSDDAAAVWVNDKFIYKKLVERPYTSMADKVPVHLNAGINKVMVKVVQEFGDWNFCVHIIDKQGAPVNGLKYTLDSESK